MKNIIYSIIIIFSFLNISYSQNPENYVARFNGFYSYVALDGNPLNTATAYTLEAWVNPSDLGPSTMSVIGKNYSTGFFLGIQATGRIVFIRKEAVHSGAVLRELSRRISGRI
ncbi:MAG: hypothetical protein IPL53_00385 [Ignavibacteria bacterium]|nr:hypothetical protein [Ignavibacteria bacterium]